MHIQHRPSYFIVSFIIKLTFFFVIPNVSRGTLYVFLLALLLFRRKEKSYQSYRCTSYKLNQAILSNPLSSWELYLPTVL
jgi:hypothetical protein